MDEERVVFSFAEYSEKNKTQVIDLMKLDHRDRVTSSIGFDNENAAESRVIRLFRILNLWKTNSKAILEDNAARGAFIALTSKIMEDGTEIVEEDGDIKAIFNAQSRSSGLNVDNFDFLK